MHRRLQFGSRENPASNRRHGLRFAADGQQSANAIQGTGTVPSNLSALSESAERTSRNAVHNAATEERNTSLTESETFEPLISMHAARLLGNIHVKTLQRYARLGRLPGYQIGGHWYFRESELDAWLRLQINSNRQSVR